MKIEIELEELWDVVNNMVALNRLIVDTELEDNVEVEEFRTHIDNLDDILADNWRGLEELGLK